jgi:hypothetical protein
MKRYSLRLVISILTFAIGVALVWPLQVVKRLESALVDRFYDINDLSPISLSDPATEANEIYRLLIHRKFTVDGTVKLTVLWSETTNFHGFGHDSPMGVQDSLKESQALMNEFFPDVQSQTVEKYIERNKTSERLRLSTLGINYVLVTQSDLPHDTPGDFWSAFYQKYPNSGGVMFVSNVGFNNRQDQALVYLSRNCGGDCGAGDYVLLRKVNGKWEIEAEHNVWVS